MGTRRFHFPALLIACLVSIWWAGCQPEDAIQQETAQPPSLTCPATVQAGDTLRLQSSTAVSNLSVADPTGTVFYAVSEGAPHPLLAPVGIVAQDAASFALTAPVDSLQMKPVAYDARTAILLFRRAGPYRFYRLPADAVSDTARAACTVTFASGNP